MSSTSPELASLCDNGLLRTSVTGRRQRCAIYTRKSSQPPIPYEMTSLEAQRAICSSYIASQKHKNWVELEKAYDDPGRSGATLDRPALTELLNDVQLGLVDVVLVYKMDRITRTLLDFVRLISLFERYGVVFVAITQNFDTSDSMGRLIRNILLTFAQFEREIAGDRIRDKKRMMSRRGLWIGGLPPLGYEVRRGKLVINEIEGPAIRFIFETFVEAPTTFAVYHRLRENGFRRKGRTLRNGTYVPGAEISAGSLHHILRNPIYVGEVTNCGERNQGIHEPLVSRELWDRAQAIIEEREQCAKERHASLLSGCLFDSHGRRMASNSYPDPKGGEHKRYYVSARTTWAGKQRLKRSFVLERSLDEIVTAALRHAFEDRLRVRELLMEVGILGLPLDKCCAGSLAAAARLVGLPRASLGEVLRLLLHRVEVAADRVRLMVRLEAFARFIDWDGSGRFGMDRFDLARATDIHIIEVPVSVVRGRGGHCLPALPSRDLQASPSRTLLALLDQARGAQRHLLSHRDARLAVAARTFGFGPQRFSRLVRLNYLAPDIVAAILDGGQPDDLTATKLLSTDLPLDWKMQRTLLGFVQRDDIQSPLRGFRNGKPNMRIAVGSGEAIAASRGEPSSPSTRRAPERPPSRRKGLWKGLTTLARALVRH